MTGRLISVIIPAYKDWALLRLCLDALDRQTLPRDRYEVIVANNDPVDPCPFAAELAANVRIVPAPRPGSYAARNTAVAVATGDVFAFIDSDCIPAPDWLEAGVEKLAEEGEASWITGPISMYRPEGGDWLVHLHDERFAFGAYAGIAKRAGATGNMFVDRITFERVGEFDATLFSGGDSEWKRRAKKKGVYLRVAEAARVAHPSRKSFADLARKERRRAGGSVKLGSVSLASALARLRPPLRLMRLASWEGVSAHDRVAVFAMAWRLRALWVIEYLRVRYANRTAERQ